MLEMAELGARKARGRDFRFTTPAAAKVDVR